MKRSKVAVLGTGDVGRVLGKGLIDLGHDVIMGSRDAQNLKAVNWAKEAGPHASAATFSDATAAADMVVLATLGTATEEIIRMAGVKNFSGKVVIDATNPIANMEGQLPSLFCGTNDSLGERVQRLIPDAKVVKAYNTVGNAHMIQPKFKEGRPDMFICGNDDEAKRTVTEMTAMWGWGVVDLGGIECSRYTEAMCMAWVLYGIKTGTRNHAFKLLKK